MSCSEFDLKDYALREMTKPDRARVEMHVRACERCRVELDRLLLTEAALFSLRDEEIPQRIAFVSDKVFEPSPLRRWLGAFWGSAPRLGFASAAILSIAILVSALTRPAVAPQYAPSATVANSSAPAPADVQILIQAAVEKAVRESEARQASSTEEKLAQFIRRAEDDRKALALAQQMNRYWDRREGALSVETAGYRRQGAQE